MSEKQIFGSFWGFSRSLFPWLSDSIPGTPGYFLANAYVKIVPIDEQ